MRLDISSNNAQMIQLPKQKLRRERSNGRIGKRKEKRITTNDSKLEELITETRCKRIGKMQVKRYRTDEGF